MALYNRYLDPDTPKAEWLSLQAQLMYAPGNERLAEKDAGEGEFPAVAAAEAKASEATPKDAWSMGGTAPMLAITCLLDRVAVPENAFRIAQTRPNTWLAGLRLRPQHDQQAARRTAPPDRRFHSGSVRREQKADGPSRRLADLGTSASAANRGVRVVASAATAKRRLPPSAGRVRSRGVGTKRQA